MVVTLKKDSMHLYVVIETLPCEMLDCNVPVAVTSQMQETETGPGGLSYSRESHVPVQSGIIMTVF
jgi:hypothetical protein